MELTEPDDLILNKDRYFGELIYQREVLKIEAKVFAGKDCRLRFELEPLDGEAFAFAYRSFIEPGQNVRNISLSARSEDGKFLTSDSIRVVSLRSNDDVCHLDIEATSAVLEIPLIRQVKQPYLRWWFRSFRSFRNPPIETALGKLFVRGSSQVESFDEMSGDVTVVANTVKPNEDWYAKAEKFLCHMHQGLALAHGGRLQTPGQVYESGNSRKVTFFAGSGFKPEFPIQNHLNHGPFIEALVNRFESRGPLPEMLWTALGWMQAHTSQNELRFLSGMTALEAIGDSQLPDGKGRLVPKEVFNPLRDAMKDTVAVQRGVDDDARVYFNDKIDNLNQKTLAQKLNSFFEHYNISKLDFENTEIRDLINLRNEIVHRGTLPHGVSLWPRIILVRELITRILLREIGFVGRYNCFIGGLHNRNFL